MSWEDILKATCVRCKKQYRGVGAEVPKVGGEYLYNIPYRRRQQIAREWKTLGLEGQPVPRVCRECAPKVTREALEREGMEVHPASWRHATKNVNVCDNCKQVWLRNHGTQMDTFPEMWVKLTNDNTICDYVKNEKGDTRRIQQKKLRGGKLMKSMEEILKVRTKGPDGKWKTKVERDTELDNRRPGGGGGGGPNNGGQTSAPEDDEDQPYSKEGGMAEDEISRIYPIVSEDDAMVSMNDEYCCEMVKELLLEYVLASTMAEKTPANVKKITKTIRELNCTTIGNLFEEDNLRRRSAELFGVNLYNLRFEEQGMQLGMDDIKDNWEACMEFDRARPDTNDLSALQGEVGVGQITEGEMKPSERYREGHRDWLDSTVSRRKRIPRRKKSKRGFDV